MLLRIASDLHLEINPNFMLPVMDNEKDTTLILAGDIVTMTKLENAKAFFADVCARFKTVLYVFGNHEFWRVRLNTAMGHFMNAIGNNYKNLIVTTDGHAVVDGNVKFIMATLWTGWNHPQEVLAISNQHSMSYCRQEMGDFFIIGDNNGNMFTPLKSKALHEKHLEFIVNELELQNYDKVVVVTHHGTSIKSIHPKYYRHPLNPAFSSDYSSLWNQYKPDLLIHGHCHNNFDYMENEKTRLICNPHGYPGENPNFCPEFVVEI